MVCRQYESTRRNILNSMRFGANFSASFEKPEYDFYSLRIFKGERMCNSSVDYNGSFFVKWKSY